MSYLARLKQLDNDKKSLHTPDNEPTKPTEPPFDGFVGSGQGHIEKIFIESEPINDAGLTPYVIAIPHPGTADRRLTIASSAGQYQGAECGNCLHLTMTQDLPTPARRRQFQWACKAGFKPLAAGYGSERVLIAPDDCDQAKEAAQSGQGRVL